ncbi:hypothetical protein RND71_021323 [Anisodus tanguticus]|uniref:Poly A polymerase head domain-containing protein n=1 Tax=Anisodus tanguticus TaxID=243964 RepID=A0AAE1VF31_9SOLA|nr:hypothetical protein RND71_021323 [Anisodus tanguticus]
MKGLSIAVSTLNFTINLSRLFTFPNPITSSSFKLKRFSIFSVAQLPAPAPALGLYATMVEDPIVLTEKEEEIFKRLIEVVEHYNLGTQLRVAGGWVRDKSTPGTYSIDRYHDDCKDCYDIDIALDNMYGREFCEKVNEYLSASGEETHGVGVIQWYVPAFFPREMTLALCEAQAWHGHLDRRVETLGDGRQGWSRTVKTLGEMARNTIKCWVKAELDREIRATRRAGRQQMRDPAEARMRDGAASWMRRGSLRWQRLPSCASNPDQSKHLETARMRLSDVWIDFVNLRAEDYSENSRIPTMKFGTAKQDADRRDLTINSLFYNINTRSVEDFTERGIADLKSGKIVTPLPPKQTFLDDPLRVLRAIRFGARFGFILDEELKKAAADEDVRVAIADKISRERIGHEIDLMISGDQPVKAMTYIADLKLFWAVFSLPSDFEPSIPDECDRLCFACLDTAWELLNLIGRSSFSATGDQRRLCLYAALFLPFRDTIYRDNKAKKIPVVNHIFRISLKLKASDAETVISLHTVAKKFATLIPLLVSKEDIQVLEVDWKRDTIEVPIASKLRILTGLLLREIKEFWRVALLLSMQLHPVDIVSSTSFSNENFELDKRSELFQTVENAITTLGLEKVWERKPLVNGKEIMNILEIKSGGPVVREWQQRLLEWQLAHPSGTADECVDWMKQTQSKRTRIE